MTGKLDYWVLFGIPVVIALIIEFKCFMLKREIKQMMKLQQKIEALIEKDKEKNA